MTKKILKRYAWQSVDLCVHCGEDLGRAIHDYFDKPCPNCAAVDNLCPEHVTTSKRFCVTYIPNWIDRFFGKKEKGFYEWSGKFESKENKNNYSHLLKQRKTISMKTTQIAATGIASGLF